MNPRTLLPALALFAVASASAQSGQSPAVVVLQHTRTGGIETLAPDAPRAGDSDAVAVLWDAGGWTLHVLSDGESALDVRPVRVRPVSPDAVALRRTQSALSEQTRRLAAAFQTTARPVVFSVEADVPTPAGASPSEAAAVLAAVLDQDDALASLSVQTAGPMRSTLAAEFAFESVEAWTEWSARSLAWQRLEALGVAGQAPRTRLSIRR